ncbi:unnamed protein product [Chondrus crispus]|uniref:Uncharacterized protein n=1 Tax=Chondrus crispus TaxID=2769 RepID=R7Q6Z0_CHOCR|nr:unnamed protein product [Chondrus crispus]CDF33799.1 unnamed protein product [Chondrus crispus]|eukprot:XP_005713618.1 unnamed protein product [Chondrus crispus]
MFTHTRTRARPSKITFLVNLLETQKSQRATTKCSRQPCFLQERFPATAETFETASTVLYFTVRVESSFHPSAWSQ